MRVLVILMYPHLNYNKILICSGLTTLLHRWDVASGTLVSDFHANRILANLVLDLIVHNHWYALCSSNVSCTHCNFQSFFMHLRSKSCTWFHICLNYIISFSQKCLDVSPWNELNSLLFLVVKLQYNRTENLCSSYTWFVLCERKDMDINFGEDTLFPFLHHTVGSRWICWVQVFLWKDSMSFCCNLDSGYYLRNHFHINWIVNGDLGNSERNLSSPVLRPSQYEFRSATYR